jgi:hypothetical protein
MAGRVITIGQFSGSDATKALHKSLAEFNEASSRQTAHIIKLTYAMLLLSVAMTILAGVQVWIAVRPSQSQPIVNAITPAQQLKQ